MAASRAGRRLCPSAPICPAEARWRSRNAELIHRVIESLGISFQWSNGSVDQSLHSSRCSMLSIPPTPFVKRRGRARRQPIAPAGLVLVQAMFPDISNSIRLVFNQAIDISAFDGTQVIVRDGVILGAIMDATG